MGFCRSPIGDSGRLVELDDGEYDGGDGDNEVTVAVE
jgi:hypothetical protein